MKASPGARLLRRTSLVLSTVLIGSLLQGVATPVAAAASSLPGLPASEKPVAGTKDTKVKPRAQHKGSRVPTATPHSTLPKATEVTSSLPAPGAKGASRFASPKGQPIGIARATSSATGKSRAKSSMASDALALNGVTSRVFDSQHAKRVGVKGLLFTLAPKAADSSAEGKAPLDVSVDYSSFAQSFGGSYASRMQLVKLPSCALTTPEQDKCRKSQPVAAVNNTDQQTLTASAMSLQAGAPTVLAATAAEEGDKGDYKATSLSPSSTWATSLNTGDFTWSYDFQTPEVPGGLKPSVGLSYSSGAIDGRTGGTNNQGSWVGDGFDLWPGSIERRYKPCADDGVKNADGGKPGDLCWAYDNAYISFNGASGELVQTGTNTFKLKNDDGTKIARSYNTALENGDNDGEYWRVTTPDGTKYYFGLNRPSDWKEGDEDTNSTWTVPVYGNDTGEKCHGATFAESWCQQGWRWNLDTVVDTHGNAITYHYGKETNSYGRNLKAEDDTSYVRGGYLDKINYGLRQGAYYAPPLAQVVFDNKERCLPQTGVTCASDTIDSKSAYWYDTPWDLNCKAGTSCDNGRLSPSFWTRKRLTGITTQVRNTAGTYDKVDSWKFDHHWGTADVDYQLLLDSIQHTGESATPAITLPKTTFDYTQLENRLDKTGDGYAPFVKDRLSSVADESGGQIDANFSAPACNWSELPTPATNTTRCFPQYIGGDSTDDADLQWFNKYVTDSVTKTDRTGGSPDQVTMYDYLGDAAWHYDDDDGLTKEKEKTWSQWRGYQHVRVRTGGQGGATEMKTQQDSYFLRGMNGDRKDASGGTKSVSATLDEGEGDPITDHEAVPGFGYKTVTFDKPGGKILGKTVSRPWYHETGKKVRDWGTVTSNFTGTASSKTWTSLDAGAGNKWRTTATATKHDTIAGRIIEADDYGDDTTSADNTCTRTTYAGDASSAILSMPVRTETVAKACDAPVDRTKDVLSDVRSAYDNGAYGAAPTKGNVTAVASLKSHDGTKATYIEAGAKFDIYGRPLSTTDLTADVTVTDDGTPVRTARTDGRTTTNTYTPTTGFATQAKVTTPPAKASDATTAQVSTTDFDTVRGLVAKKTDTNNNVAEYAYDALGRTTKVWAADRRNTQTPTKEFVYTVDEDKPVAVATKSLNNTGGQITSYELFDGFLRSRQTQDPGPDGGGVLADTFYDERGLVTKTFEPYYVTDAPSTELFKPDDALSVETQTRTAYDGLNRAVQMQQMAGNGDGGQILNTTKTIYGGDRTTTIPPVGGTATTVLSDARGNTVELRQLHSRSADAAYDSTTYHYTPRNELDKVTDPAGNHWTYTYDQLGRKISTTDPDQGTATTTYDDRGQVTFTKGSRTDVPGLAYLYDDLGRQTEVREKSATGTLRTKQVYDTVSGAKGQLAESTRYVNGQAYTSKVTAYDKLYRPIRTAVVIPAAEGALQGTYQTGTTFLPSGLTAGVSYSAAGSLPGGSTNYTYDNATLRPATVYGEGMTSSVSYSLTGKPLQYQMSLTNSGKITQVTNTYEWGTQRLATSRVDRQDQPGVDRYATYHYDEVGNVRAISDTSRTGTDNQCSTYDYLGRLTEAWVQPTTTCATAPAASQVGGPAPYWQTFTYDKSGNRATQTRHDVTGDTAKDLKDTYTYPKPGTAQAHSLSSRTTTSRAGSTTDVYTYDASGNTITRPGQSLTWDVEDHLASVTKSGKTTSYLYDASGNRLIGRTPTETTLYLGNTEVALPAGATKAKATRYFDLGGGQMAIRSDDGTFAFTVADQHGTGELSIQASSLAITQRRTLPFGGERGTTPTTWPGTKGFVGGTDDTKTTGLTHLGAREYDADLGRFISVDPVLDLTDPQQMNGYTYSNNNPATYSDPTGLWLDDGTGHNEPRPGQHREDAGKAPGGTGENGCYYTCGQPSTKGTGSDSGDSDTGGNDSGGNGPCGNNWFSGVCHGFGELVYGVVGNVPRTAELAGWLVDGDCWHGGAGAPGCDYGNTYDEWVAGQGFDTSSDMYLVPSFLIAMLTSREPEEGGAVAGPKPKPKAKAKPKLGECHSFAPGTGVLLADGTQKAIEDVEVGDVVRTTDVGTGVSVDRKVIDTITTDDDKYFTDVTIADGGKLSSVIATDTHPFWVPNADEWVEAGDLVVGQWLKTSQGDRVRIVALRHYVERQRTHDLTIQDIHAYYVLAGSTPVLVHNSNGSCGVWQSEFDNLPKGRQGHVREMPDEQTMRDAFERWTAGAEQLPARGPKIPDVYRLEDGTVIQWRTASASGGATVDIQPGSGGKPMKVHLP
ncbi:polymorphic toxin-type HINT domain-containing protein [Streptomyces drozdowiczii]|uniref:Polymorphic toxin-type HINT domain-containing protein n=2 Tax=Streptomyces drozdowiczii TaxID=202862 RepID=A0ABY6PLV5_9ACTN|nr:RHS repeat-associated core domain-containing protein [Streptomyces drozdowiczii]UZK52786.1 polymorphic toxin-type HINT domain-containing protein [Streptomyces drozdowiczii]